MLQRTRDSGTFSEVPTKESSFLARLKPSKAPDASLRWLDPQDSVGKLCCNFGHQKFWEIKDPGREKLACLEPEVRTVINTHNEHLKDREACNVAFAIFMVGREETLSCPTLVIISSSKNARDRVLKIIRSKRILDKYHGVLLGSSSKHPRYPDSLPGECIASGPKGGTSRTASVPTGIAVYVSKEAVTVTSGSSIYIPSAPISKEVSRFRRATLGGFLELRKKNGARTLVGMTVAHAFHRQGKSGSSNRSALPEDDSFEFEFDGPTPDDLYSNDRNSALPSKSSSKSRFSLSLPYLPFARKVAAKGQSYVPGTETTSSIEPFNEAQFVFEKGSELTKLGTLLKTSIGTSHDLDWALIKITATGLTTSNTIDNGLKMSINPVLEFSTRQEDIEVATCTGSKHSRAGVMSGYSTSLKIEHASTFEDVRTVKLSGHLLYGDSGSWIVERDTGRLCGHIVAGDVSSGLAYIAPAKAVFEQIESRLFCHIALPEFDNLQPKLANDVTNPQILSTDLSDDLGGREQGKGKAKNIIFPPLPSLGLDARDEEIDDDEKSDGADSLFSPNPILAKSEQSASGHKERSKDVMDEFSYSSGPSRTSTLTEVGRRQRERDRERDNLRRARRAVARTDEYFVPRDGIDREVITADIHRYLGNNALVRPGSYENPVTRQIQQGYFITAYRNLTTAMVADVETDTQRWEVERRVTASGAAQQLRVPSFFGSPPLAGP